MRWTAAGLAPDISRSAAVVWRRSWKRIGARADLDGIVVEQHGPPLSDLLPEHLDKPIRHVDVAQVLALARTQGGQAVASIGGESVGDLGADGADVGRERHELVETDGEHRQGTGLASVAASLVERRADIPVPDGQRALKLLQSGLQVLDVRPHGVTEATAVILQGRQNALVDPVLVHFDHHQPGDDRARRGQILA
jgi:hypothetical protein